MIQSLCQEARDGKTTGVHGSAEEKFAIVIEGLKFGQNVHHVRQMKRPQVQNTRVKQLVAELSLDDTMLQDVLRKEW